MTAHKQSSGWKIAFFVLAIAAICMIGYLGLRLFFQSAEISQLSDGFGRRERALALLRRSIPDLVRSNRPTHKDVYSVIQKHSQGAAISTNASAIEVDLMRFCFGPDESLDRIEQADDYGFPADDIPTNRPTIPER